MSGNEITGIHNFFEENSSHQSQVAGSGHIVANINPWIGTQAMSRVTPSDIGLSQFGLKQHINRSQSKNQQLNVNELMHASTALQGRSGQRKFEGDGAIPDNLSLMQRGLANFGSQEGNSSSYGSGYPGSLEKPDVTASPVSFDFLGGQQQLSGHPGMPHPHQMHQQGSNDMQWKQHLIAMQMQEIQRQQQFQQLHLGARQHNSFNQMYGATGQGAVDELPGMLSGMPVANAVNYMPSELMGSQSKSPNSSHMFIAGNMNWAQRNIPMMQGIPNGLIYSQDQGQSVHAMGFVPRQSDQSLHGTPVSGGMGSLNHYFQLQGMPNDSTSVDLMSKLGENHAVRTSMMSSALNDFHNDQRPNEGYSGTSFVAGRQGTQGKTLFGNALVQDTDTGTVSGSIPQSNHLAESVQVQGFQDGQVQTDWLGKSHDSITAQLTPSHTATSLDPTEEKILFGVDDSNWEAPIGGSSNRISGTYLNGYPMQNNDCLNVFPSLQSGTWSALVQEALEVSSSDTGQQEEWSGLSLHKADPQTASHLALLNDSGKQNAVRDAENNLHDTLRSKPFPLLSDTTARQSSYSLPSSQQPIKYSYEQNERLESDHSIQSVQQLSKERNDAQFAQNYQPYNFIGNSLQERQRQLSAPNDVWVVQEHQQAMQHMDSAEMGSNSQAMQHSWIHQQKMPFYNMNSHSSNKLSWGIESPSSSGSRNFKNDDNGDLNHYARSNDLNPTMHIEMTHHRSLGKVGESKDAVSLSSVGGLESVKSDTNNQKLAREHTYVANFADFINSNSFRSNMVINQQLLNRPTALPFRHVTGPLYVKDKEADQVSDQKKLSTCPQDWDPSPGYTNKESGEAHGHAFSHLNTVHVTCDAPNERDNSLLARNDHLRLISGGQKFTNQSDRKSLGSQRFQFHPMGNLEINMETANQEGHKSHSQGSAHPTWGLKNQEKENFGNSQLIGHVASNIDVGKDCFIDPKKSSLAEIPHAGTFSAHNPAMPSFNGTTAHFFKEKRIGLPSQNVHMLFDKSDQSDDCSSTAKQNISENNSSSGMPEGVASEGPISHLQRIQANHQQASGLKLAHPSQRQPAIGNSLMTHTPDEGTHQSWSSSTTSGVALPTIHETSRRENLDYKTILSPQTRKDAMHSNTKGNSMGMMTNIRNQSVVQQLQLQSHASRQSQFDLSVNQSFGSKVNADGHPKHLHPPQAQDPHDRSLTSQTSQALFPGMPGKVSASRLASFPDNSAPPSQFFSQESGNSDMINASSDGKNASQLLQVIETVSANLPSAVSVVSQQGHFSNIFNNAWRNAATQRPSGLQSQKFPSNLLQSLNSLQPQLQDDQRAKKGGNSSAEAGTYSINSQQFTYAEENPLKGTESEQKHAMGMDVPPKAANASEVQEQESKNILNKSSTISISSSVHLHQQDDKKGKHGDNQKEKVTFPTVLPLSSDVQTHSYSLLQQMQAMKGTDTDPSKVVGKRLKGTDSDAGSLPSDVKMLSFSSREIDERCGNASNHIVIGEMASYRPASSPGHHELQIGSLSSPVLDLTGTNECNLINPQMASSWFEQYGNYKDIQTSGMSDSLGSSQRTAKAAAQHYFFSKTSVQMENDVMMKRRGDSISENSSPTAVAADSHTSHLIVADESLAPVRKKQKIATSDLLSWHKEVTQSSRSLQSFSLAKMEWARVTNRLIEKIEDDTEGMDDVPSITRPKRRLILTTQLIQQLFPPVPTKFLFQDSLLSYEKVIYYLTKLTLGDACSLIPVLGSDTGLQLESGKMISENHSTPKEKREQFFSNIVDNFIMRLRRLQGNFLRLENGFSVVDFRMECQDVERGSIINRFAKFHGRGPTDGIEGSSVSETVPRRSFPQRNVTVLPMPRNLPDGVVCLLL